MIASPPMITFIALGHFALAARNVHFAGTSTARQQKASAVQVAYGSMGHIKMAYVLAGRTGTCVLDTGSPTAIFRSDVLKALGKPTGKTKEDDYDADGPITVGKLSWPMAYFYTAVEHVPEALKLDHVDGVIGFDMLSEVRIISRDRGKHYDLEAATSGTVDALVSSAVSSPNGLEAVDIIPLDVTENRAYLDAKINGISGRFIVDTGSFSPELVSQFARKVRIEKTGSVQVSTLDEGVMTRPMLGHVTVEVMPGLSYQMASCVDLGAMPAEDLNDAGGRLDGLVGNEIFQIAESATLDIPNHAFLTTLASPKELQDPTPIEQYPSLPTSAGPLVVRRTTDSRTWRVFCPQTNSAFGVPGNSALPRFASEAMMRRSEVALGKTLGYVILAPGQPFAGWSVVRTPGGLQIAYPPNDIVYIPKGATYTLPKSGSVSPLSNGAHLFLPGYSALSSKPDKDHPAPDGPLVSEPGKTPAIYWLTSASAVAVRDDCTFSCLPDWSISALKKGWIFLAPPKGRNLVNTLPTPPSRQPLPAYHYAWYPGQWAGLPNMPPP